MKKYQITVSNKKSLIGNFDNKKHELIYEKIWSANNGLIKVDKKIMYKLISTNFFNTNFKLTDIGDNLIYETYLLWNGSMQINYKFSKFILKQDHSILKNNFIVLNENNEIIIKLSVEIKLNKIMVFNFEVNNAIIENLELLFFVIANGTLFYLNLKRITL